MRSLSLVLAPRLLLLLLCTLLFRALGDAGGLRGGSSPPQVIPGKTNAADVALDPSAATPAPASAADALAGAVNHSALDALGKNLTTLASWDYNRCRRYPWELHCLEPSKICPYMPWMPQCRDQGPPAGDDGDQDGGVHPPSPAPSPSGSSGNIKTLYHQTSPEIAALIYQGGFKPGKEGWCGGGIYFATSPKATYKKAIGPDSHIGEIIEAQVDVGKVWMMPPTCDRKLTGNQVAWRGYDSVTFNPGDGFEFVVYSPDRVVSTKKYEG